MAVGKEVKVAVTADTVDTGEASGKAQEDGHGNGDVTKGRPEMWFVVWTSVMSGLGWKCSL